MELFSDNQQSLSEDFQLNLPLSFSDFEPMTHLNASSSTPANLVNTIFTIFVMLKIISIGHPSSKPYYDEICQGLYPDSELKECEEKLFVSLQKFDHFRSTDSLANGTFEDSYETLMFLMQHMVRGTKLGINFREKISKLRNGTLFFKFGTSHGRLVSYRQVIIIINC